jgi:N-terminal domain of anti-restriction factor ArdC
MHAPAARDDATRRAHELLLDQLGQLTTSAEWLAMLDATRRFHTYSARNVMLLIAQGASGRVAGYRTWQTIPAHDGQHCQVRRGATGLLVLAPVTRTVRDADATTGEETTRRVLAGFKAVRVFDEAALASPPAIPEVRPALLAGHASHQLFDGLAHQLRAAGFSLVAGDCAPANGETSWTARQVTLRGDLDGAQRTKTLAHELAHIRLHNPDTHPAGPQPSRARAEVEAESVAYLVCTHAGLDTAGYTIPYVALWSDGNLDLVADTAEHAVTAARAITSGLHAHLELPTPDTTPRPEGDQPCAEHVADQPPSSLPDPLTRARTAHPSNTPAAPDLQTIAQAVERDARRAISRLAADPNAWGADNETAAIVRRLAANHPGVDPATTPARPPPLAPRHPTPPPPEPPGIGLA